MKFIKPSEMSPLRRVWFWISLVGALIRGIAGAAFVVLGVISLKRHFGEGVRWIVLGVLMIPSWDNGWRNYPP